MREESLETGSDSNEWVDNDSGSEDIGRKKNSLVESYKKAWQKESKKEHYLRMMILRSEGKVDKK